MAKRSNKYHRPPPRELPKDGAAFWGTRTQTDRFGVEYLVRQMGASRATKFYICPGCNQNIPPGIAHVVAWEPGREDDRRHWHKPCWQRWIT
ncbi:hypothetical protein [Corynebacterium kalinowskii]|uniref:hypothetical protein n=1 Tax=Corynebacterium kalinowskii TaxID=2675216 RepID=UPI001E37E424|nr:hypothetical protein [Corynebacterium kalinowskii]